MAHGCLSLNVAFHFLLHGSVRAGQALMVAQMFRLRIYQEYLQVAIWILEIDPRFYSGSAAG
jgi:hypothetical protein